MSHSWTLKLVNENPLSSSTSLLSRLSPSYLGNMNNVIYSVDEVVKEARRVIETLGRLLPAIPIGSRRRDLRRDAKAY